MRAPRGQNMVLLALTLLLVTLMVTMTIGLGLRIRQKHELQNLADAAAYSNAVATARVFNNISLANRVEVSYWVAMAADQSLIDWTSYARAMSAAAAQAANQAADDCDDAKGHDDDFHDFANAMNDWQHNSMPIDAWRTADQQAGDEVRAIQGQISSITEYSWKSMDALPGIVGCTGNSSMTKRVLDAAGPIAGVSCVTNTVSERELFPSASTGLVKVDSNWNAQMRDAAMGTRGGDSFITVRGTAPTAVMAAINGAAGNKVTVSSSGPIGSSYWASLENHGGQPSGYMVWADDDGSVTVSAGNCSYTTMVHSHVKSTALQLTDDDHAWTPGSQDDVHAEEITHHTMGPYIDPQFPGVWVRAPGFLPASQQDAWGQPKLLVALKRDLNAGPPFPWELHFTFGSPTAAWDGRAGQRMPTQAAYATAMVYYHRAGQQKPGWLEFPNLLNPFWRATLVPVDVDHQTDDVTTALGDPTWSALLSAGYKGIH